MCIRDRLEGVLHAGSLHLQERALSAVGGLGLTVVLDEVDGSLKVHSGS